LDRKHGSFRKESRNLGQALVVRTIVVGEQDKIMAAPIKGPTIQRARKTTFHFSGTDMQTSHSVTPLF